MTIPVLVRSSALLLCVTLSAQSTPAPVVPPAGTVTAQPAAAPVALPLPGEASVKSPDPEAPTHYGMRYADFVQVNEVMMQTALEDPAIVEFSKQVEAMIAQREDMIAEAACRKYPVVAEKIRIMQRSVAELKRKKAEQDAKRYDLGKADQPVAPKS